MVHLSFCWNLKIFYEVNIKKNVHIVGNISRWTLSGPNQHGFTWLLIQNKIDFFWLLYARLNWVKSNKPGWSRHWHKVTTISNFQKHRGEKRDVREERYERDERGEIWERRDRRDERGEIWEIWERRDMRDEIWERRDMREERYERGERGEIWEKKRKHCTYKISWIFFTKYCTFRERITFSYERKQMDNQNTSLGWHQISCHAT